MKNKKTDKILKIGTFWPLSMKFISEMVKDKLEPVITHLVFNLTSKVDRKWGCYTYFESGPPKDHFNSNFRAKDFDVIFIS